MAAPTNKCLSKNVFICSYDCGKVFSRKDRLIIHQRCHTAERPFICGVGGCDKTYSRCAHLKRHIQASHQEKKKTEQIVCPFKDCTTTLSTRQNLKKHILRKHTDLNKFICEYDGCGKICKSTKHRYNHQQQVHMEVNPLVCTVESCKKEFPCNAKLKIHMKKHAGYKCQEEGCVAVLPNFALLRKHIAVEHAVVRECPVCEKKFLQKSNLRIHLMIHTNQRPVLECPHANCQRQYLDNRNLQAHIRSYHCGIRVKCLHDGCERSFVTKVKMLSHLKVHDPNRPLPKKKHRKKVLRKARKHREHMASLLVGIIDGHMTEKTYRDCGLVSAEEEDKIVLSEDNQTLGLSAHPTKENKVLAECENKEQIEIKEKIVLSQCPTKERIVVHTSALNRDSVLNIIDPVSQFNSAATSLVIPHLQSSDVTIRYESMRETKCLKYNLSEEHGTSRRFIAQTVTTCELTQLDKNGLNKKNNPLDDGNSGENGSNTLPINKCDRTDSESISIISGIGTNSEQSDKSSNQQLSNVE